MGKAPASWRADKGPYVDQLDNRGLDEKLRLRREALAQLGVAAPMVLEAFAGAGKIGASVYRFPVGVAVEKVEDKAAAVARERPGWRVYEGDCVALLSSGLAAELPINFLDLDPFGDPWPALRAFLRSDRTRPPRIVVAINDGLRKGLRLGIGWRYGSFREAVLEFGADLYPHYMSVCRWMVEREAAGGGYRLAAFRGFYGGRQQNMTHSYSVLERDPALVPEILPPHRSGRPSPTERGYGAGWTKKRAAQLRRRPWCEVCRGKGRGLVLATDVDHRRPKPEGGDEPANLQSLCHACHSRKTAADPRTQPFAAARRRSAGEDQ